MRLGVLLGMVAAIVLSGCVDQNMFVRQGVTYDKYERDNVGCSTRAAQQVPTNTQIGWAPYVGIYSSDTNAGLRIKNFELCMRDKGYQKVKIPYCSGEAAKAATDRSKGMQDRSRRMKITPRTCYVAGPTGAPFLYSPEQ